LTRIRESEPRTLGAARWVLCCAVLVASALAGCTAPKEPERSPSTPSQITVRYVVTTRSEVHIYYGSGSTMASADVASDWSIEQKVPQAQRLSLTVTSSDFKNAKAEVSCEIIAQGKSVALQKASGNAATANCVANLPATS
jgi:hypothetical protein